MSDYVYISVIEGRAGPCLSVGEDDAGGTRVCGPKPWGGGRIVYEFKVERERLNEALEADDGNNN